MIKAIVFDLDDTLISERKYVESGYKHISNILSDKYGLNNVETYNELLSLFEINSSMVFNRFLDNKSIVYEDNLIRYLISEYRAHTPNIKYYDDVLHCLFKLKEKKLKTGIITDGYEITQYNKLKSIEAFDYFDEIIITDKLGREYWKPSPKPFELIKDKFNINYDELIYVGDNPKKDFFISSIYPIKTIRIIREDSIYKNEQYLNDIKPNYIINNLMELIEILHLGDV